MLEHIKNIVKEAEIGGYGIGAFNIHGLESVLGVANAAVASKSPAIIQMSEGAIKYAGLKPLTKLVSSVAENVATQVPIALHLDHGRNLDYIFGCINAGFSSVHIDASDLPLDENIALTKQVIDFAHAKNVWVQGEVGAIMGGHGDIRGKIKDIPIAKLEDVVRFVKETGVDTIAAAIGTAHGVYDNEDILMDLLQDIKKATKIPFVLHGGSGVDEKKIKKSIDLGVNIVNIGSDIKIAFSQTLIENCKENPSETDPRNLLRPSIKAVEDVTSKHMNLFGSAGRVKFTDTRI